MTARSIRCHDIALITVLLCLAGCHGGPPATDEPTSVPDATAAAEETAAPSSAATAAGDGDAATIAALDPMFGHGNTIEARALGAILTRIGDEAALEAAVAPMRGELDATAEARVANLLAARHRPTIAAFLESPAGRAVARAEQLAMLYPYHETLPQKTVRFYRVEARVGDAAIAKARDLDEKIATGASPSPSLTAVLVGARLVRPEHARELDALLDTEAGQAWLQARSTAWDETVGTFARLRAQLVEAGLLQSGQATSGDPELPRDAASEPDDDGR